MSGAPETLEKTMRDVISLRHFSGSGSEFWAGCLASLSELVGAVHAVLLVSANSQNTHWNQLLSQEASSNGFPRSGLIPFKKCLQRIASSALINRHAVETLKVDYPEPVCAIAVSLSVPEGSRATVAVFCVPGCDATQASEHVVRLCLNADLPASFSTERAVMQLKAECDASTEILRIVTGVYEHDRFMAACMNLCNALAEYYACDRVSLGMLVNNQYVRLRAMSGTARFDKKADVVRAVEVVMEEATDQDEEVVWPLPEGFGAITREHQRYAQTMGTGSVSTVPLRRKGKVLGAICCERDTAAFTESEMRQMALIGDAVAERVEDLRRRDRWFPLRAVARTRELCAQLLGVEHTWAKLAGVAAAVGVIVVLFGSAPYRIEAPFIVKADSLVTLSAPFDGFVARAGFDIGDRVSQGDPLLSLDTSSLLLEQSAALADLQRHEREAEKHWAEDRLADMRISRALAEQSRARLELVTFRIERSALTAPFDGVVVEGEWEERLNASVRQGDTLATIAQLDGLYLELEIDGADIARVQEGMQGQAAFISDPKQKYAVSLERLHPAATASAQGPVFHARAAFDVALADWWRPGMSGIAKIDVGERKLWWIFGHRTADYLRQKLWW